MRKLVPYIIIVACLATIATTITMRSCDSETSGERKKEKNKEIESVHKPTFLYGICVDSLDYTTSEIGRGETIGKLLSKNGASQDQVNKVIEKANGVFDLRMVKLGNSYSIIKSRTSPQDLLYFIYKHSNREYVIIDLRDEVNIHKHEKEVVVKRRFAEGVVNSSLWMAVEDAKMNINVASKLEDVYQWSIDFHAIQKGDTFKVIYDEEYIDGESIGVKEIYGACFKHNNKDYYAVGFQYNEKGVLEKGFWDEEGKSLKSAFLKAPLKFTRISSKFSYSRLHPITRVRRPHLGVDYAAPSGTPVYSIANGVVTSRGWGGGGGNTIKIRHAMGYVSGYLHLKSYAKGITVGSNVKQGQLIGYVGSTGMSTGPHLDFRIWKNGTAIDPLKLSDVKGNDLDKQYRASYDEVKSAILKELKSGEFHDGGMVFTDSLMMHLVTVPKSN